MIRAGFTLTELLIALGIILLLAAILTPVSLGFVQRAQSTRCLGHLRQIGVALQGYLAENDMRLPELLAGRASREDDFPVLETVLPVYGAEPALFHCPADRELFAQSGSSYFWNNTLNGQRLSQLNFLNLTDELSRIPLVYDKEGWHRAGPGRVNFLYADGRATRELVLIAE
jgi:prepilin-type N-terminal cleavage/methylation domain-containing protein/prepilin-type processing-associated H-X9-DG protein